MRALVKVRAVGWLKDKLGFEEQELYLDKPSRLTDFLPQLQPISDDHVIVLVNGKPADKNTTVDNNDEVILLPMTGGG